MTDQDTTQTMPTEPQPSGRKRLLRSRSDKMLGGVAGGLARYFDVDPVIFRIGFGVTVFFGGLGIVTYLALMIFVPAEDPSAAGEPAPRSAGRILLTIAAAIGGAIALAMIAAFAFFVAALGHGVAIAAIVIAAGALIALGATRGGRRWLIAPALALALPLGAVAVADVNIEGGVGEREYKPTTVAAIPTDGYRLGLGDMRVDLRQLPWKEGDVVRLHTDQGVGRTLVAIPDDVCVIGTAAVQGGNISIAGDDTDGWDAEATPNAGSTGTPRLVLDADLDFGQIEVVNSDIADLDEHHFDLDSGRREEMRQSMAAACAPDPEPKEAAGK